MLRAGMWAVGWAVVTAPDRVAAHEGLEYTRRALALLAPILPPFEPVP
jgi:hypothetical protein